MANLLKRLINRDLLSRKQRLTLAFIVLLLALGTIASLIAGCGSGSTSASSSADGKVLVFAIDWAPYQSLDPAQEATGCYYQYNTYETLTRYDAATRKIVPALATSWEKSPDGRTWTFHLRQGVKFHDGTMLDSQVVKSCFQRTIKMGMGMAYLWKVVSRIQTPEKYIVVFKLSSPRQLDVLAAALASAWVYSTDAVEKYGTKCFQPGYDAGSGPYTLKAATTTEVTLARFPDYWGGWQGDRAKAPEIGVVRQVAEPSVRIQGLEQGDFQLISTAPPAELKRLSGNPGLKIWNSDSFLDILYMFTTNRPPLNDPYLRQALRDAYPYQQVVDLVLGGYGSVATGPTPKSMKGYEQQTAAFPPPKQNMQKAREALAKSAYPKGVALKLIHFSGQDRVDQAAQLYKASLSELGINLEVTQRSVDVLYTQMLSKDPPQDIWTTEWYPGQPDPNDNFNNAFTSWSPYNTTYWSTPEIDQMISETTALGAVDPTAALQQWVNVWRVIDQTNAWLYATDDQSTPVASVSLKGFTGFNPNYNGTLDFYNVWLAK